MEQPKTTSGEVPRLRWPATPKKSVWGPALWIFLHTSATFSEDAGAFCSLISSLAGTLPCPECRAHLRAYVARMPPEAVIVDSASALRYVQSLHDHVDMITKKAKVQAPTLAGGC